ncbi:HTH-type transcriptional repressor YcgE [compost metagenome]
MPVLTDVDLDVSPALSLEREELFPIREVARLTGVNPVTLRAWERRHGLIVPTRTESGHRLYSMTDIERVRSILNWIERGVAVSKISKILAKTAPLQALAHIIPNNLVQADYAQWQQQLEAAVSAFDDGWSRSMGRFFPATPSRLFSRTSFFRCGGNCCSARTRLAGPASGCSSMVSCAHGWCSACC